MNFKELDKKHKQLEEEFKHLQKDYRDTLKCNHLYSVQQGKLGIEMEALRQANSDLASAAICPEKRQPEYVRHQDISDVLDGLNESELRTLYATIGGKLGKRKISAEQQDKMQAARKRKVI